MKIVRTYSLEWLDALVSVTLNPHKPYRQKLQDSDIAKLLENVPIESLQVQSELTAQIFSLNKDSQVRHLVRKYYGALLSLHETLNAYLLDASFNKEQLAGLDTLIINCLADLISFVEKRFNSYITETPFQNSEKKVVPASQLVQSPAEKQKVLCTLSSDQIALILRAADESQVLKARSMNAVFKFIIPYLSTPHKENLSAAAVRSKAYNPEEADRDAAVDALQKIIKKIQGY